LLLHTFQLALYVARLVPPDREAFSVILGIGLSGVQQGKVFQWDSDHEEVAEVAGSFDGFPIRVRCRAAEWEASQGGQ
jgi:hypothetical protein